MAQSEAIVWSSFVISERNEHLSVCQICDDNISQGSKPIDF